MESNEIFEPVRPTVDVEKSTTAFTLVEMLVSMSVLAMLTMMLMQMVDTTTATTTNTRVRLLCDEQATMIFDRLGLDILAMPKRQDIDSLFSKLDGNANDAMFFFSEMPGYFDSNPTAQKSPFTLVGYRVSANYQLERIAKGLAWSSENQPPGSLTVLTTSTTANSFAPIPESTLPDNPIWKSSIGTWSALYQDGADVDYSILSRSVLRMEFCYMLKDGSASMIPVEGGTSISHDGAPTLSDDVSKAFAPGSRWWDRSLKRGYVCISAQLGNAQWANAGWTDVAAVVVALVLIDPDSRKLVPNVATLSKMFADPNDSDLSSTPPHFMEETWNAALSQKTFAAKAGISAIAASHIYIYQRFFDIYSM